MGYMRHHAIVVTYWDEKKLSDVHAAVRAIDPATSDISPEAVNGYRSFFVPPDGSKEGWGASGEGDARRERIKDYLKALRDDDVAWPAWVEVQFGDDELKTIVVDDSDAARREKWPAEEQLEPKPADPASDVPVSAPPVSDPTPPDETPKGERPCTGAEFVAAAQAAIEPRSDEEIRDIIADIEGPTWGAMCDHGRPAQSCSFCLGGKGTS